MLIQKITLAASVAALSATLLASNASAMQCSEMTGNQLLAAIERGNCEVVAGTTHTIVETDKYIRTAKGSRGSADANSSGGGYGY